MELDPDDEDDGPHFGTRNSAGRLVNTQCSVFGLDRGPCYIFLARPINDIFKSRVNNFYFKHILHPSEKGRTPEEKNALRLTKRNFTTKQKKTGKAPAISGVESKGAANGRLSWYEKYGAERGIEDNTVICLSSELTLDRLGTIFLDGLMGTEFPAYDSKKFGKATIRIDFPSNCVISVNAKPCNYMYIEVDKVLKDNLTYFDIYHFDYVAQGKHGD